MRALLDVNVLIALLDPQSRAHLAAYEWLGANFADGWASCPLTENACLRILTNPAYASPAPAGVVLARLEETKSGGDHAFWPDDLSITDSSVFDWRKLRGPQQVTDIYLLALAFKNGGRLVTLDQRIQSDVITGIGPENLVTLGVV